MTREERRQKLESFGRAPALLSAALRQFPKKMWLYRPCAGPLEHPRNHPSPRGQRSELLRALSALHRRARQLGVPNRSRALGRLARATSTRARAKRSKSFGACAR